MRKFIEIEGEVTTEISSLIGSLATAATQARLFCLVYPSLGPFFYYT